ncbi:B12-binding domain-containing radical SAM protein [Desulfovibrio sp. SGI.169]|uniref:B12-binding domain-containing radical SAM protein n=1 Tax=Desulfovibrio sp. SGI.169 TaxID=3420561 RepID=UPI003CFCEB9D
MSQIVFVNAYEFDYLGTRALAAYLLKNKFTVHCILLDDNKVEYVDSPQENFIGYQVHNPLISEHRAMHHPLTEADWEALCKAIQLENPQIIGFSARSTNNFLAKPIVEVFKKAAPTALLVAGGYGPTLNPELYLQEGFDVVVRGDGEEAIFEIAKCIEENRTKSIYYIQNTIWNKKYGKSINKLRDQEKDLSIYPAPLYGDQYFSWIQNGVLHRYNDPMLSSALYRTFLGRGCPGKCTYCSGGHWRTLYRKEGKKAYARRNRNFGDVIKECSHLPPNIKTISFCDEYWSLTRQKTEYFFTLYKKYVNKPFWAYLNYEQMVNNPELLNLIIDAGLDWTGIGFQTGAADFLQKYYGRIAQYPLLIAYANLLFKNFVTFSAQFIGGNCYETYADLEQTLNLIRELPCSLENLTSVVISNIRLRPHPKSPITYSWPDVVNSPMPVEEWHFRAILMEYCRFFTPEEFSSLLAQFEEKERRKERKQKNMDMEHFFQNKLKEKQLLHYQALIKDTAGQPWIYYGAGDCFIKNQKFFSNLKPEAVLVDKEYMPAGRYIAGIPVFAAEDFFNKKHDEINFMVFLKHPLRVQRKLLRHYGIPFHKIHSCSTILRQDVNL